MKYPPRAGTHVHLLVLLLACLVWTDTSEALGRRISIPLSQGDSLQGYLFTPCVGVRSRLPAVICGVGVGGTKLIQYHAHCQALADRGFVVALIDPSDYPESLTPGPYTWDTIAGYLWGSVNQGVVAGRLFVEYDWYLQSIRATVNYVSALPFVDPCRIVLSGFSQPANAALTYACRDPRIRAIVWNYGGSPWILPYEARRLPPVCIFHGTADTVYDVKYAVELAGELGAAGRYHEIYIYPGQGHMFNVYYDPRKETRAMRPEILDAFEHLISFLRRVLSPYPSGRIKPY